MQKTIALNFEEFDSITQLDTQDQLLVENAHNATKLSYAPYSNFLVGVAALLKNGQIITGSNQENASYAVTICAERTLLSIRAMLYPDQLITTIAVSYNNLNGSSNKPLSPCGVCRQALLEHEVSYKKPMRIILSGINSKIIIVTGVSSLLPFAFSSHSMD